MLPSSYTMRDAAHNEMRDAMRDAMRNAMRCKAECPARPRWVFLYIVFGTAACPAQQTLISLTLLFCLALTVISCSKVAPHTPLTTLHPSP